MNHYVVDASIAAKWIFLEQGSDKAQQLLEDFDSFLVPELFYLEMDAIITKKVRKRELDASDAHRKREQVEKFAVEKIEHYSISQLAFNISISLPVTFYDAIYLALAVEKEAVMWSADDRLVRGLSTTIFSEYIENPLS
jgi:predicted nucleic acid-binding protein